MTTVPQPTTSTTVSPALQNFLEWDECKKRYDSAVALHAEYFDEHERAQLECEKFRVKCAPLGSFQALPKRLQPQFVERITLRTIAGKPDLHKTEREELVQLQRKTEEEIYRILLRVNANSIKALYDLKDTDTYVIRATDEYNKFIEPHRDRSIRVAGANATEIFPFDEAKRHFTQTIKERIQHYIREQLKAERNREGEKEKQAREKLEAETLFVAGASSGQLIGTIAERAGAQAGAKTAQRMLTAMAKHKQPQGALRLLPTARSDINNDNPERGSSRKRKGPPQHPTPAASTGILKGSTYQHNSRQRDNSESPDQYHSHSQPSKKARRGDEQQGQIIQRRRETKPKKENNGRALKIRFNEPLNHAPSHRQYEKRQGTRKNHR
jgi:hypothetical protein